MRPFTRRILLAAALLAGCDQKPPPAAAPKPKLATYEVRGVVQRVDAARGTAVIAHEEIPGYMEAMTMEFTAAVPAELAPFKPGDVLAFSLRVTDTESHIGMIRKTGQTTPPASPAPAGTPPPGTPLPDVTLVDDAGRQFRLADHKGAVLVITFIFTRCPLPDFCPRMNMHFAAAQKELGDDKCHFISITFDPAHDTPERLAEYARSYRSNPSRWTFATGGAAEIRKLASFAGLEMKGDGPGLTHNLRTLVVDADGRVTRVFSGNEWQPSELTAEIKRASNARR